MKFGFGRILTIGALTLLGLLPVRGQTAAQQKPLMAEDVFKNVQVLKGIPVNQFMETMGFFSAALGYNCTNCHGDEVLGNWAKYADDIPVKQTARRMIQVVNTINKNLFGGGKPSPATPVTGAARLRKSFRACWNNTASRPPMIRTRWRSAARFSGSDRR